LQYKGVIFDLDGTLLNSLADLANSTNAVLKSLGFPCHEVEKYKCFIGNGMYNLVRKAFPEEYAQEKLINKGLAAVKKEYGAHWADYTVPYQGITELLPALQSQGLRLAVLSNKPHEFAQVIVEKFFPGQFEQVFGERSGIPRKPNPQGALDIAAAMKISPHEFLYVGDSYTDMQTAVAAGMYPIGVLWGFQEIEQIQVGGAKVLLEKPLDLLKILKQ
jgi:phosphoglycolate phosphatase